MNDFDELLVKIGSVRRFQIRAYAFVCLVAFGGCLVTFAQVFVGGTNDHWCKVKQWQNDNCSELDTAESRCGELQRNLSTPTNSDGKVLDSHCVKYNLTGVSLKSAYANRDLLKNLDVTPCDQGWNFNRTVYSSTITEDWELVCEMSSPTDMLQSITSAGRLIACILFGSLADTIGRLKTIWICTTLTGILCILSAASPNVVAFGILRFLADFLAHGASLVCFVYGTELVIPDLRVYYGVLLWFFFAMGYFVLAAVGRFVENWRHQLILLSVPYIAVVPFLFILAESPRWLLSKRRYYEAEQVIKKIAWVNGKCPPAAFMTRLRKVESNSRDGDCYCDIFRHRSSLCYTVTLMYIWFAQSFVYYGLSLGTSSLGVNVYIAFCISGAAEIPSYAFSILSMKFLGRKISTGSLMILAGLSCFATVLSPLGPIRVIFAMIGGFAISASFSNIYLHTAEIFPTPLRTLGIGSCSVAGRLGGIIAPLVIVLERIWQPLPLFVCALSSLVAGVLVFLLPETKGKSMPDTIEETLSLKNARSAKLTVPQRSIYSPLGATTYRSVVSGGVLCSNFPTDKRTEDLSKFDHERELKDQATVKMLP